MAEAVIMLSADAFEAVCDGDAPKGDVLAAARIAGIMAANKNARTDPAVPCDSAGFGRDSRRWRLILTQFPGSSMYTGVSHFTRA